MNPPPVFKNFDEFVAFYNKGQQEQEWVFKYYQYGIKERQRYRDKERIAREKAKILRDALPPELQKKAGRPRKPRQPPLKFLPSDNQVLKIENNDAT